MCVCMPLLLNAHICKPLPIALIRWGATVKKRDPGRGMRNPAALHTVLPRPGLRKCINCTSCFSLMANIQQSHFFLLAEKRKSLPPITVASQETVLFSLANIVTLLYNVLASLTDRGECHSLYSGFHSNVVCFIPCRGWRHFQLTLLCVGRHSLHEAQAFHRERV